MTPTETSATNRLSKRRRYRRLMFGSVFGGAAGFVVVESLGYPLVAFAVYWLGIAGFLAVWRGTSISLFDERDNALERQASAITLTVFAVVLVAGGSSLTLLSELGVYSIPPELDGALLAYAAQFGVFGVVYLVLRYRR